MKYRILPIKNVSKLLDAGDALLNRSAGMPGIGMVWGPTGYGKTTAATWLITRTHGVYLRAMACWSPAAMLAAMQRELDLPPVRGGNAAAVEAIVGRLAETGRPVFVDEADYVVERRLLVDTLRDIHDLSASPVILIGMSGLEKRIRGNPQFTGRTSQWIEFKGADLADSRILADGLCEVRIADDLLERIHAAATPKAKGSSGAEIRRLVVAMGQVEAYARARGLGEIGSAQWHREDFFVGSPEAAEARRAAAPTPIRGGTR